MNTEQNIDRIRETMEDMREFDERRFGVENAHYNVAKGMLAVMGSDCTIDACMERYAAMFTQAAIIGTLAHGGWPSDVVQSSFKKAEEFMAEVVKRRSEKAILPDDIKGLGINDLLEMVRCIKNALVSMQEFDLAHATRALEGDMEKKINEVKK